jgi:DNA sulfur modification protein DndD
MKNFRPYHGPELIKFAEGEKNITIIQGENDSGKTSLMNAITWCLYNKEYYRSKGKEDIWNKSAVKDIDIGDELSVEVTIVMEDNSGETVRFVRSKKFIKRDELECSPRNSVFNIFINDGEDDNEVTFTDSYLQTHLPETLHEYFLFDGEQLTNFFNKDSHGVKSAVYDLSQLNLLEKVINHTKARRSDFYSKARQYNPELN